MSDIPYARVKLLQVAHRLRDLAHPAEAIEIEHIVRTLLVRDKAVRRVRAKSRYVTVKVKEDIKRLARSNLTVGEIAHQLNVNQGRVSEVLNGKR